MKNRLLLLILLFLLSSCEKAVDFELEQSQPKLVIDATIENDEAPVVVLSKSLNYFSTISAQQLSDVFIHDAIVEVSNGIQTHRLKEISVPLGGGFSYYYYSNDPSASQTAFVGQLNKGYTLKVTYQNEIYTAATSIPNITKRIDSIWWKEAPLDTSGKKAIVMIKATDPSGFGDYVRYWTKKNRENYLPGFTSVYDDLIIDGSTYELQVEPGFNRNLSWSQNVEEGGFKKGDTISLKLSNIDKATYDFWRTLEYSYSSVGNPFSTPIKVTSNIKGNALGYFGGYASQYSKIIIPR